MKITKPSVEIIDMKDYDSMIKKIEKIGRVCYKSENNIKEGSAERFIAGILKRGHESVIEHEDITVRMVCDRGVTHEIVRHRIASYSQESTRYCNYSIDKFGNEITVIDLASGFKYDLNDPLTRQNTRSGTKPWKRQKNIISRCWNWVLPHRKPALFFLTA